VSPCKHPSRRRLNPGRAGLGTADGDRVERRDAAGDCRSHAVHDAQRRGMCSYVRACACAYNGQVHATSASSVVPNQRPCTARRPVCTVSPCVASLGAVAWRSTGVSSCADRRPVGCSGRQS
jgi:hypothetical protein